MAKPNPIDLKSKLTAPSPAAAFSMMLGGNNNKDIRELEISSLFPYPNQPFKPYTDERLQELAEDIRENGVLSPVIVRPVEDGFQIIAGHNRVNASRLAGKFTVPCIIKEMDDNTAQLIMVNSNLNQRQELLPSEKAFAYKMQMDALYQKGRRTDLMHNVRKVDSLAQLSDVVTDSRRNISYYIRLTFLIPPLLQLVDNCNMPMRAGVELSYLTPNTQARLLEYITAYDVKLDLRKAALLRERSNNGELTRDQIYLLLEKPERATKEKTSVKIQTTSLRRYFPDMKPKEIEKEIEKILKQHFGGSPDSH